MAALGDVLTIWTITYQPRDMPGIEYAARAHRIGSVGLPTVDASDPLTAPTLDEIRALLPPGLVCLGRAESDDPVIVESWI